jgi:ABC-type branched-subunit amino acid transport system permease subunit
MPQRLPIIMFALVLAAIPFIPGMPPFWIVLLDNIGLAALVAMGLVLLTGVGGLTSFGQAAFCGFGAYTTAVLTTAYGVSPWLTLPLSLLVGTVEAFSSFYASNFKEVIVFTLILPVLLLRSLAAPEVEEEKD